MSRGRATALCASLLIAVWVCAQPRASEGVFATFPKPSPTKDLLFYIQRNKNANTIVYEARMDASGRLSAKDPVRVNWIRHTEGGVREEISMLEATVAYGVKHRGTEGGVARMNFVASDRYPFTVLIDDQGQAEARITLNGRPARLHHVEINAEEGAFWPKVTHIDIHGTDLATGRTVVERYIP